MKNRAIKKTFFNMIEVVLAMAIIAFGMTSILGLFPVGLNALKASMADNSCSDAIDQVSGYVKNQAEFSTAFFDSMVNGTYSLPAAKPTSINSKSLDQNTKDFLTAYITPCNGTCKLSGWCSSHLNECSGIYSATAAINCSCALYPNYPKVFADWNIYKTVVGTYQPSVYFVIQGATNAKTYDFGAMVLVWKSPVVYNMKYAGGSVNQVTDSSYVEFSGINLEVSWPLQKPYAEREKRYYYVEVRRP